MNIHVGRAGLVTQALADLSPAFWPRFRWFGLQNNTQLTNTAYVVMAALHDTTYGDLEGLCQFKTWLCKDLELYKRVGGDDGVERIWDALGAELYLLPGDPVFEVLRRSEGTRRRSYSPQLSDEEYEDAVQEEHLYIDAVQAVLADADRDRETMSDKEYEERIQDRTVIAAKMNEFCAELNRRDAEVKAKIEVNAEAEAAKPFDVFGGDKLTPPPELTRDMVPDVLARFAFDQAERLGVEPAMVLIPAITVCAAAISDTVRIQPLEHDTTWTESARLWTATVADPGTKKTPAMKAALGPILEIEREWIGQDSAALARYEARIEHWKKSKALGDKPTKPKARRVVLNDFTMDALAVVLADNERGALASCDELIGLISSFDAYRVNGAGKDRAAALELWNGGPRTIDRKKEGSSVAVPNWGISIVGGIQPDRLRSIASSLADDGFLQRFSPFFGGKLGEQQDRTPDAAALEAYRELIRSLTQIPDRPDRRAVTLSPEAHRQRLEVQRVAEALSAIPGVSGALRAHLEKWGGIFARLLLTLHVVGCISGETADRSVVGPGTARMARNLMLRFFLPHALRFYGEFFRGTDVLASHAEWVAGYILARRLNRITARDIKQSYRDLEADNPALGRTMKLLERANWVGPPEQAQRNSVSWAVNPAVHTLFAERAAQEAKKREEVRREIANARITVETALGTANEDNEARAREREKGRV